MHVLEESIVKLSKLCLRLVGLQPQAQEAVDLDGDGQADFVEPPPGWLYYTRGAVFWVLALLLMQARPTAAAACHPRPVLLLLSPPAAAAAPPPIIVSPHPHFHHHLPRPEYLSGASLDRSEPSLSAPLGLPAWRTPPRQPPPATPPPSRHYIRRASWPPSSPPSPASPGATRRTIASHAGTRLEPPETMYRPYHRHARLQPRDYTGLGAGTLPARGSSSGSKRQTRAES